MNNKQAIILLSGGLDSIVSIAAAKEKNINFVLALTFDYGQKAFEKEKKASAKIAKFYNIPHKCIKLDWLKKITHTSLVSKNKIPEISKENLENNEIAQNSMKNVWVPNRNGLFINIAAAFCDAYTYDYIVIGANKEEAQTFSDNSKQFINDMNKVLKTSVNTKVKVLAPLINLDKNEIVETAIKLNVPLKMINSCYCNTEKHCGKCESCNRLKRALESTKQYELIKDLFD